MHNSRFKYFLIPGEDLVPEANLLNSKLLSLFKAFDEKNLNPMELIFLLIGLICEKRRPGKWWMKGKYQAPSTLTNIDSYGLELRNNPQFKFHLVDLNLPSTILNLDDFLLNFQFKNLPQGVFSTLYRWRFENLNITLKESPITPLEMLTDQAQGTRVVTVSTQAFLKGELINNKRDALEFLLHDLCHADLYFSNFHNEQKLFFSQLLDTIQKPKALINNINDEYFMTDLEYIMSDMNSNYYHLVDTLRGKIVVALNRQKLSNQERLNKDQEMLLTEQMLSFSNL
jgi:hypothetical protein